jgi:hypothetical protein
MFLTSPISATCPAHLILLTLVYTKTKVTDSAIGVAVNLSR